jgi:DNA modification methylase
MGSGTTLIAAEMTGRVCLGLELNPAYVDVAVTRWQDFTGEVAVLESTGQAFGTRSGAKGATEDDTDAGADDDPG